MYILTKKSFSTCVNVFFNRIIFSLFFFFKYRSVSLSVSVHLLHINQPTPFSPRLANTKTYYNCSCFYTHTKNCLNCPYTYSKTKTHQPRHRCSTFIYIYLCLPCCCCCSVFSILKERKRNGCSDQLVLISREKPGLFFLDCIRTATCF